MANGLPKGNSIAALLPGLRRKLATGACSHTAGPRHAIPGRSPTKGDTPKTVSDTFFRLGALRRAANDLRPTRLAHASLA